MNHIVNLTHRELDLGNGVTIPARGCADIDIAGNKIAENLAKIGVIRITPSNLTIDTCSENTISLDSYLSAKAKRAAALKLNEGKPKTAKQAVKVSSNIKGK